MVFSFLFFLYCFYAAVLWTHLIRPRSFDKLRRNIAMGGCCFVCGHAMTVDHARNHHRTEKCYVEKRFGRVHGVAVKRENGKSEWITGHRVRHSGVQSRCWTLR